MRKRFKDHEGNEYMVPPEQQHLFVAAMVTALQSKLDYQDFKAEYGYLQVLPGTLKSLGNWRITPEESWPFIKARICSNCGDQSQDTGSTCKRCGGFLLRMLSVIDWNPDEDTNFPEEFLVQLREALKPYGLGFLIMNQPFLGAFRGVMTAPADQPLKIWSHRGDTIFDEVYSKWYAEHRELASNEK